MLTKLRQLITSDTSKDTLVSLIGSVGVAGLGMLFTIITARALSPSNFGVFSALVAIAVILSSVGDLGISSALVNFLPKLKSERSTIISVTFWLQLITALILGLIVLLIIPFQSKAIPGSNLIQVILTVFLVIVLILENFAQGILRAERKFFLNSVSQISDSGVKLAFTGWLFFQNQLMIESALAFAIISGLVGTIIGLAGEFGQISFIFPKHHLKSIFTFSKWIAVTRVFSVAISRVDVILLTALSSTFEAGIFAAASRIAMLFTLMVSTLGSVIAPRFSVFNEKAQVLAYLKKISFLVGGIAFCMGLSILLARPIVSVVFGSKYLAAIPIFQAMTIAMVPFLLGIITINPLIYTYNKPKFVAGVTVVQIVLLLLLDWWLIPIYGAMGPAISLFIVNIIVLILTGGKLWQILQD